MAGESDTGAATERSKKVEIEDRWLAAPLMAVACGAIMFLSLIAWVVSGLADSYGYPITFIVFVAFFGSSAQLTSLVSIIVYYKESKALEEAGSNWVPIWWIYGIATISLGAFIVVIYLVRRLRNTNVDWSQIRGEFTINA
jgi:heme/copper-type cytochrome/quinol oxidase subunit 2